MAKASFEIYRDDDERLHWRLWADSKVLARSAHAYVSRQALDDSIAMMRALVADTNVVDLTGE